MKKLKYVDELMRGLAGKAPKVRTRRRVDSLARLRTTLGEYYDQRRKKYAGGFPDFYDKELKRLFSDDPKHRKKETAAAFLRRNRVQIRHMVARWTGEYESTLDIVLKEMMGRCRDLKLRAVGSERQLKLDFAIVLTVKTMHHLYAYRPELPL